MLICIYLKNNVYIIYFFIRSWAVSTVMTRLNMVPSETIKDSPTTALIPLWDMCNHTNGQVI